MSRYDHKIETSLELKSWKKSNKDTNEKWIRKRWWHVDNSFKRILRKRKPSKNAIFVKEIKRKGNEGNKHKTIIVWKKTNEELVWEKVREETINVTLHWGSCSRMLTTSQRNDHSFTLSDRHAIPTFSQLYFLYQSSLTNSFHQILGREMQWKVRKWTKIW